MARRGERPGGPSLVHAFPSSTLRPPPGTALVGRPNAVAGTKALPVRRRGNFLLASCFVEDGEGLMPGGCSTLAMRCCLNSKVIISYCASTNNYPFAFAHTGKRSSLLHRVPAVHGSHPTSSNTTSELPRLVDAPREMRAARGCWRRLPQRRWCWRWCCWWCWRWCCWWCCWWCRRGGDGGRDRRWGGRQLAPWTLPNQRMRRTAASLVPW